MVQYNTYVKEARREARRSTRLKIAYIHIRYDVCTRGQSSVHYMFNLWYKQTIIMKHNPIESLSQKEGFSSLFALMPRFQNVRYDSYALFAKRCVS